MNSKDASLNHVSGCEYWTLDRNAGVAAVTVTLSWDTRSCGVTSLPDLRVARWDGTSCKNHGNGGTTGNTSAGTIVTAAAVTSFGPFTLASSSSANPLPIKLICFSGQCKGSSTVLNWSTAFETINEYFTLESSTNSLNWMIIGKIDGAGNSNSIQNYTFKDSPLPNGIFYYRLKQTDLEGNFKYSEIIG